MKHNQYQMVGQKTVFPSKTKETNIDTSISNIFSEKLSSKQLNTALEIIEIVYPKKPSMPVTDDTYGFPLPRRRR